MLDQEHGDKLIFCNPLSPRQKEVLSLISPGKSNNEIAECLNISEHTVDFHVRNIFDKLHVNSRITAVVKAISLKLIAPL